MKRSLMLFVLAAAAMRLASAADPFDISAPPLGIELPDRAQEPLLPAQGWRLVWFHLFGGERWAPSFYESIYASPTLAVRDHELRTMDRAETGFDSVALRWQVRAPMYWSVEPMAERTSRERHSWPPLDAPGPGYREQRQQLYAP